MLSVEHKFSHMHWARKHVQFRDVQWRPVIFSYRKKFNLEGPDGLSNYWHDIRKYRLIRISIQLSGGGVMILAAFSFHGRSNFAVFNRTHNAQPHCAKLNNFSYPLKSLYLQNNEEVLFQQDNESIYTTGITQNWFRFNFICLLNWHACSLDFNLIENLWDVMVRDVYKDEKQYRNMKDLKSAKAIVWSNVTRSLCQKSVVKLIHRTCIDELQKLGGKT